MVTLTLGVNPDSDNEATGGIIAPAAVTSTLGTSVLIEMAPVGTSIETFAVASTLGNSPVKVNVSLAGDTPRSRAGEKPDRDSDVAGIVME